MSYSGKKVVAGRATARIRRQGRVRRKIRGTDDKPRLSVYRSNRYLYVQVISDQSGRTLASASTRESGGAGVTSDKARQVGAAIAEKWGGRYRDKIDVIRAVKSVTTPIFPHPVRVDRASGTGVLQVHESHPGDLAPPAAG